MKLLTLTIKNVGILADVVLPLNKPLILLYGDIRLAATVGNRWLTPLGEIVGRAHVTVRKWAAGMEDVPDSLLRLLILELREK